MQTTMTHQNDSWSTGLCTCASTQAVDVSWNSGSTKRSMQMTRVCCYAGCVTLACLISAYRKSADTMAVPPDELQI